MFMSLTTLAVPLCLAAAAAPPDAPGPPELPPGLFAYESFDTTAGGAVAGSDGGAGWDGPWRPSGWRLFGPAPHHAPWNATGNIPVRPDQFRAVAESLEVPGLAAAGGAASVPALSGGVYIIAREVRARVVRPGAVYYVGVRLRANGELHEGAGAGFFTVMLDGGSNFRSRQGSMSVWFGKPVAQPGLEEHSMFREWSLCTDLPHLDGTALRVRSRPAVWWARSAHAGYGVAARGGSQLGTGVPVAPGRADLLVLRVECAKAGIGQRYDLFVNPDPAAPRLRPAEAAFALGDGPFTVSPDLWVTLAGSGAFTVDELRVADSLAGACGYVPPAEEPAD